jgi:hypothetical protein
LKKIGGKRQISWRGDIGADRLFHKTRLCLDSYLQALSVKKNYDNLVAKNYTVPY